ncbi:hypothetical protein BD769DRAFT_760179 [Suillus cothurnatus]|nr:hypothetical protein BD769DRAFT_760179 [Suillus cothurnatus]
MSMIVLLMTLHMISCLTHLFMIRCTTQMNIQLYLQQLTDFVLLGPLCHWCHFPTAQYFCFYRCIFKHYEVCQANLSMEVCLLSSLVQDPPWFSYPIDHYCEAVPALPATVLRTVTRDLGCDKSESCQKELSTDVILRHFVAARLEFSGLTNDMIAQRLGASLPSDSLKFRGTYLAAGVVHLYGADVTAALRCSLIHNSSIDNESN